MSDCLKSELDWASLTYYLCSQSLTHVISVCAMTFRCCARNSAFSRIQVVWVRNLNRPIRRVPAQPGVRKVEAGAPWAVGSATRAWNFSGVYSVTKVENLCYSGPTQPTGQPINPWTTLFQVGPIQHNTALHLPIGYHALESVK